MRLLLSLTFCTVVLVNALAQNTLAMAMVCMVNSTFTEEKNQSHVDEDSNCPPLQDALNDYQVQPLKSTEIPKERITFNAFLTRAHSIGVVTNKDLCFPLSSSVV